MKRPFLLTLVIIVVTSGINRTRQTPPQHLTKTLYCGNVTETFPLQARFDCTKTVHGSEKTPATDEDKPDTVIGDYLKPIRDNVTLQGKIVEKRKRDGTLIQPAVVVGWTGVPTQQEYLNKVVDDGDFVFLFEPDAVSKKLLRTILKEEGYPDHLFDGLAGKVFWQYETIQAEAVAFGLRNDDYVTRLFPGWADPDPKPLVPVTFTYNGITKPLSFTCIPGSTQRAPTKACEMPRISGLVNAQELLGKNVRITGVLVRECNGPECSQLELHPFYKIEVY